MVVIDTNLLIDHLRLKGKDSRLDEFARKSPAKLAISLISVQELYEGKSTKNRGIESAIINLLNSLEVLDYTFENAKLAGEIARDLGRPIDLADAAIAATVIINEAQLFTLNTKDFKGIKQLELI